MKEIRWNQPSFDDEDITAVTEVLRNNYVNEGPKTHELEEILQKYLNVKHIIMVANGTAALFLAIKADAILNKYENFEVIIPDMTMIATATAVNWAGGRIRLIDIEDKRLTLDYSKIEENINQFTKAIIPVHILGRSSNMDEIMKISKKHNLTIIEDAAGALGSKNYGKFLGTIGNVGCFSLQSNKIITCGQGGFVATNNDNLYETMRRIRDFGRFSNKEKLHQIEGYNLKFSDLSASLIISQLKKIDERKELLIKQRKLYEQNLENVSQIKFPSMDYENGEIPIWVDAVVNEREKLVEYLINNKIYPRECWPAIHKNPAYNGYGSDKDYPVASSASDNVLWLPNGPGISIEDILEVSAKIRKFYLDN